MEAGGSGCAEVEFAIQGTKNPLARGNAIVPRRQLVASGQQLKMVRGTARGHPPGLSEVAPGTPTSSRRAGWNSCQIHDLWEPTLHVNPVYTTEEAPRQPRNRSIQAADGPFRPHNPSAASRMIGRPGRACQCGSVASQWPRRYLAISPPAAA